MIKVHCRTNLDLIGEVWPKQLPAVPAVGHLIQSTTKWGVFQLELRVVSITWKKYNSPSSDGELWMPEIELHQMNEGWSIRDFYNWYAPLVGRTAGSFI